MVINCYGKITGTGLFFLFFPPVFNCAFIVSLKFELYTERIQHARQPWTVYFYIFVFSVCVYVQFSSFGFICSGLCQLHFVSHPAAQLSRTPYLSWRAQVLLQVRLQFPLQLSSREYLFISLSPSPGYLLTSPCTLPRATSLKKNWGCLKAACIAGGVRWKMTLVVGLWDFLEHDCPIPSLQMCMLDFYQTNTFYAISTRSSGQYN